MKLLCRIWLVSGWKCREAFVLVLKYQGTAVSSASDVWNCIVIDLKLLHFQGLIFSFVLLFFALCLHSYFMKRLFAGLSVSYIQCIRGDTFKPLMKSLCREECGQSLGMSTG